MNTTSRGGYPNVTVGAGELATIQEALATVRAESASLRERLAELQTELESHANQEASWKTLTSDLRERLATAEEAAKHWAKWATDLVGCESPEGVTELLEARNDAAAEEYERAEAALADAAALREQLAKPENWPLSALNENNAQHAELVELRAKLRASEALALTNGDRVTRAEALLLKWVSSHWSPWGSVPLSDTSAFLAPTEPDGASGTKEMP